MNKKRKRRIKKIPLLILLLVIIGIFYYLVYNKHNIKLYNEINEREEIISPIIEKKVTIIDLDSNSRSYAVMVNNVNAAWKYQRGLCNAYMVYSLLVEGGITREMALFKDAPSDTLVMSIRSARHYFLDYVLENDAIYVHWGWSPYAESDIKTLKINNINGLYSEGTYFFRDKDARSKGVALEHTGYISIESMDKARSNYKYRATTEDKNIFEYSAESIDLKDKEDVTKVDHIEIRYSGYYTAKYDYDTTTRTYKKMQNNTVMEDYNGGCDLSYKNIITYQIPYTSISGDKKGRLNATTIGSGTGYLITEGYAVPITWEKSQRSDKTIYKYKDGTPLVLNDGLTAIELQPKNQKIVMESIEDDINEASDNKNEE